MAALKHEGGQNERGAFSASSAGADRSYLALTTVVRGSSEWCPPMCRAGQPGQARVGASCPGGAATRSVKFHEKEVEAKGERGTVTGSRM